MPRLSPKRSRRKKSVRRKNSRRRSRRKSRRRSRRKSSGTPRYKRSKQKNKRCPSFSFGESKEKWIIYTKKGCPFCKKAVETIKARQDVELTTIDGPSNMKKVNDEMERVQQQDFKTWPKIFKNGEFIGGYMNLEKYLEKRN